MKTLIIGGVAGGATAATRLRRRDEQMEIILFERGEYVSYANCGLPYHIGDVIKKREALLVTTPEKLINRFKIDVRIKNEVLAIDKKNKKVIVNGPQGEYEESYDELIIATGSSPLKPPIPGIDGKGIHTLWTIPDTDRIKAIVDGEKPRTAAVIGGGFIGLEMAENLVEKGISVSVVEAQNQVMAPVDFEMAQLIHENMDMNGVELFLGDGVKSFEESGNQTTIHLSSGKELTVDLVITSIGIRPNSELAKEAGLDLNERGGIKVDQELRTSHEHIWAVGDVIEIDNFITKEKGMIPLAGPANKQGRIVADNITGAKETYRGTMGTSVAKVFDLTVAGVGLNEKVLKAMGKEKGKDYHVALINQKSYAGYYPGATPTMLKMIFSPEGKIFGGQIVGQENVDKRIDTLATTIGLNGTIYDLQELELAYAPPYSSAKDPVNMLGYVAENMLEGIVEFIDWEDITEDHFVLDVMEDMERIIFEYPGSHHIPLGQLREKLDELPRDKTIVTYCALGVRSYNGARILMQNGFKVKVAAGGSRFYKSNHYTPTAKMGSEETENPPVAACDPGAADRIQILDCCGLQCPGPILKVNEALLAMAPGELLKVSATDMGFAKDVENWCKRVGHEYLGLERSGKENIVTIKKGSGQEKTQEGQNPVQPRSQGKSMIVFDGDLDKVLASFIIANGAAAMGRPVTMFFTFWGLNALRKREKQEVKKPFMEKMFGTMMPRGSEKLKLSNMNMGGMGTKMMKKIMKEKNVASLEELMEQAMKSGVRLVACTMSMDVMGITPDELIDGVEFAGVASYLADAEQSDVNLFI